MRSQRNIAVPGAVGSSPTVNLLSLVLIFSALSAFAPLATDMYLASFPQLATSLHTDIGMMGLSLSVYFIGLSVGQIFYGPLIDRFGRKPPLLIGIFLYTVSSGLLAITSSIWLFLALRLLQAIGGCGGMVVSRTMVSDLLEEREAARFFSLMMVVTGIGPIVAPIMGGYLLYLSGWQSIFIFLTLLGLICLIATQRVIPETWPPEKHIPLSLGTTLRSFGHILVHRRFMVPTLLGGITSGAIFAFIGGAPFVYMQLFGVAKDHFGWVFGLNAIGITLAAQANRTLLKYFSLQALIQASLAIETISALLLLWLGPSLSLVWFVIMMGLCLATIPLVGANTTAMAMAACGEQRGAGSSILGVLQFAVAALASAVVGLLHNGTMYPMLFIILGCCVLSVLIYLLDRLLPDSDTVTHA